MNATHHTLLTEFFADKQVFLIVVFGVSFHLRVLVNSIVMNQRDGTNKMIMFLSPFKQGSGDFLIEAMLRFWWPAKDGKSFGKSPSNILSLVFLISLSIVIINGVIEAML
ncbi:hypothetical protein [Fulvivirga ligni]|uniref:hypothetical protein n=1 Tax=Fulvivirga ligni TaxID=2904246 RepID=UPI001F3107CD|nr:hypothetical protein [Fulvivirga ligni]UII20518.1 hypothetical protein LVD16_22010 [Fulvivirga ligni]